MLSGASGVVEPKEDEAQHLYCFGVVVRRQPAGELLTSGDLRFNCGSAFARQDGPAFN